MKLSYYAKKRILAFNKGFNKPVKNTWDTKLIKKYLKADKKLLDIGCASGYMSKLVKDKNNYFGVEYNEELVEFCRSKGFQVKKCDISKERIPFASDSFDVLLCSHVLEHLSSREQNFAMNEFSRVLKKGGILILFAPTPYHWYFWDDHTHIRPCTHGQLEHLALDSGFEEAKAKYSKLRFFSHKMQRWLRLPPLRFFLWEVYLIARK